MALSRKLNNVTMTYRAPCCGAEIRKPGRWFATVSQVHCPSCATTTKLPYDAKLKLFEMTERRRSPARQDSASE